MPTHKLFIPLFAFLFTLLGGNAPGDTVLVPKLSTWKYLDNGTNQGTAWKETSFSDATWNAGPAELGYGDSTEGRPETTVVGYGPDPNNRYITTYFRRSFTAVDAAAFGSLTLRVMRDDGAVVYLNGQEIWRDKMPTGTIGYRTLATAALGGADEYTYAEAIIPATHLSTGQNVIAVEIHQANATSSDISFDLELVGRPPGLVRQPYLQVGTPTSIVIRWRTDISTDTVVRFGAKPDALTSEILRNVTTPTTEHEVILTGLTPDTRYYYSVGSSTATYASGEACVFYTAPPAGVSHPTRIWAIGDAGTGTANQAAVRDAYYNSAIGNYTDVMLMLGDNVYETGTDPEYTTRHFNVYQDILRRTVTWPTIGNHDTASSSNPSSTIPYYRSFSMPTAGEAGGVPSGTKDYYSFDYGDIHFICLDSMTESRSATGPMVTWLRQDLANTTQKWLIAYWHHPPYSKGHDSDSDPILTEMRQNVVPLLEEYGVDLVLSGHSHAYERSWLMDSHYGFSSSFNPNTMRLDSTDGRGEGGYNKPTLNGAGHEGAVYAVAGSSGKTQNYAGINDSGTGNGTGHPAMFISWERLGSLIIDVDGHRMDVKFLRENGAVADTFSITRGPRTNAAPVATITAPANGAEFNVGGPIAISTTASDADQGLRELVLYANESRIATLPLTGTSASVTRNWTPPGAGNYRLQARAVDQLGNSGVSAPVDIVVSVGAPAPDTTPPGAIANLTGTPGVTDVTLTWRAPGDDGDNSGTAASYDIRYSLQDPAEPENDPATWWASATPVINPPVPQAAGSTEIYAVASLSPQTSYYFAVKATDDESNVSALSNVAAVTTLAAPPAAPTNLTAANGALREVLLSWTDNSSDEDGFSVERSLDGTSGFAQLAWVGPNVTSYSDTLVYEGSVYFYRVLATKGSISSTATNVAKVTVPPPAPANLQGSGSSTRVDLTWFPSTGAQSYTVSRLNASGGYDVLASNVAVTNYSNGGLSSGTSYTYRVAAVNAGGTGPFSEVTVLTTMPNPPAAPSNLSASPTGTTTIELQWASNANNASGVELERSTDGTQFETSIPLAANVSSYLDSGLTAGTTYWYRVRNVNADGPSAYSNTASATTLVPQPPAAPTNLSGFAQSGTQIDLSWVDASQNETGFYVESATGGGSFNRIATVPAGTQTFSHSGLVRGATYSYRVQAFNNDGESSYSGTISVTTFSAPAAPTALAAIAVSVSQVNLAWTDNANNEQGFHVERSTDNRNWTQLTPPAPANATTFASTGLSGNKTYYFRVRAYNGEGTSAYSNVATAKTPKK